MDFRLLFLIFEPAVFLIIYIQLFNWFSKKQIAIVYGLMSCFQAFASMTTASFQFYYDDKWLNYRELFAGAVLLLIAFIEWRFFKFYPLEAGIFIDVSGRSKEDLQLFN
jgi:hypothetical protein